MPRFRLTAISGRPSRSKSAATSERGPLPTPMSGERRSKPAPLSLSKTVSELPNRLEELLPDDARFAPVVRVVDLSPGYQLLADIVSQRVVCCLAD